MKKNIVIVGGGNIGSRHMQAFASATLPIQLYLLDPSSASLEVCKTRWAEVKGPENKNVEISFHLNYSALPSTLDLAIIATNAQHRFQAFKQLSDVSEIHYLILEKFLFNHPEEYALTETIVQTKKITAHVNCARRQYESYHFIKSLLSKMEGPATVSISGNNWGMGSNAIHFLDLFCFLTDQTLATCQYKDQENTDIIKSKREGYVELFGTLSASTEKGDQLSLSCHAGDFSEISISIEKNGLQITALEKNGKCIITTNDGNTTTIDFPLPYQSQLTNKSFEQLINGEKLHLTTYENAILPHLKFLDAVTEIANYKGYSNEWKIT